MDGLKAFRINEYDCYAGRNLEEAIEAHMAETGATRDEAFDKDYGQEVGNDVVVRNDSSEPYMSIGEILATMDKPGVVCGFGEP